MWQYSTEPPQTVHAEIRRASENPALLIVFSGADVYCAIRDKVQHRPTADFFEPRELDAILVHELGEGWQNLPDIDGLILKTLAMRRFWKMTGGNA